MGKDLNGKELGRGITQRKDLLHGRQNSLQINSDGVENGE